MGVFCEIRMDSDAVSSNMEEKDFTDINKDFGKKVHSDQENVMVPLMPSASLHPISLLKSNKLSGSPLYFDEWLASRSTISGSSVLFLGGGIESFVGSNIEPIKEASLSLRKVSDEENNSEENAEEQDVFTWIGSNADESSASWPTNIESAKDSPGSENTVSPISILLESPRKLDLDKTTFCLSLLKLDREDSKWLSDEEADFDSLQSNFPSPSFRSYLSRSPSSMIASACGLIRQKLESMENASAATDLEDLNGDDPIFWPFERKFDWASWDCFTMSPRRGINIIGSRVSHRNINLNQNGWSNHRLVIRSSSASSRILEHKQRNLNRSLRKPNAKIKPSRMQKSTKASAKVVPLDTQDDLVEPKDKTIFERKLSGSIASILNDGLTTSMGFMEEIPIESLVGLPEFDGHEGVFEFNEEDFFLD